MKSTGFENYLVSSGYIQYGYNKKSKKYEERNISSYSTMVDLISVYKKNSVEIVFGLFEYPYPPTLITRPRIKAQFEHQGILYHFSQHNRDIVDIMFEQYSNEDILKAIEQGNVLNVTLDDDYKKGFFERMEKRNLEALNN